MKPVSKSPYRQNYIQHQIIKKKEIQPIIHNRNYSTTRNINPSELNDQKYAFNINQPNYNIPINQKICTKKIPIPGKKIPILKRINKPISINQNTNFGNVHNQNNFNENYNQNYLLNNIQNQPLIQKEIQYFQNPQIITVHEPIQQINNINNAKVQPVFDNNFNNVNNGQLGQVNEPVSPQIIVQEFQTINPRINPLDNNVQNNERIEEISPAILTTNQNEQTNFNINNNIMDNNKNKDYIINNINYKNNNTIDNNNKNILDYENKLKKAEKKIKELLEKINALQIQLTNEKKINNDNNFIIQKLKQSIKDKDSDINIYKFELENLYQINNKKESKYPRDQILSVNFVSIDKNINFSIPCIKSDIFAVVEEKLYKQFPKCRETNNNFSYKNNQILRFKTISQNNIIDGTPVYF